MNPIPTPPTDSLSKFAAISGLWITLGTVVFFTYYVYISDKGRQEVKTEMVHTSMEFKLEDLRKCQQAISEEATLSEEQIKQCDIQPDVSDQEQLDSISTRIEWREKSLSEGKDKLKDSNAWDQARTIGQIPYWAWVVSADFGLLLLVFGVCGWYREDKRRGQEFDLRFRLLELEIQKLESEA